MKKLSIKQDPRIPAKFQTYPKEVQIKLDSLRDLIIETAEEIDDIKELVETLKWQEPSYLVKKGSTIRMDWKEREPKQYALYFNCNSRLVETFRAIYGDLFSYEKNRALVFQMNDEIPVEELKKCLAMALQYHRLKNKVFLGE